MNEETFFQRIGIYGVGLMGGSLGLALQKISPDSTLIGIGRSVTRLEEAVERGAIHSYSTEPDAIFPLLDLLIVCTPVRMVPEHVRQVLPSLAPDALVTDVGSTKASVVQQCEETLLPGQEFVGSHPMAGSHKTGIEAACPDLYRERVCVVTQTERSHPEAVRRISRLWERIGMRVVQMTPQQHDKLTAYSSHLPHITAAALCHAVMQKEPLIEQVLGNGFRDTTRIAAGDPSLWLDICLENRISILDSIQSLITLLEIFHEALDHGDETSIRQFLEKAQKWKLSTEK